VHCLQIVWEAQRNVRVKNVAARNRRAKKAELDPLEKPKLKRKQVDDASGLEQRKVNISVACGVVAV